MFLMTFFVGYYFISQLYEEEERRDVRIARRVLRDRENAFSIPDREFIATFGLNKEACNYVINQVTPGMESDRYTTGIPIYLRCLYALSFLTTGSYQRNIGNNSQACLSQSTLSLILYEFCDVFILTCMKDWIQFPSTNVQQKASKLRFVEVHQFPHVIGIVENTHIAIAKPKHQSSAYMNKKSYYSLNTQIICDADANIISVSAKWPGSWHKAHIWRHSKIGQNMLENYNSGTRDTIILGHRGYPCYPWLFTPVSHPSTVQEERYNTAFNKAHTTVKRTIGLLKARFRCLLKEHTLQFNPKEACRIIITCAILYNIAKKYRVEEPEPLLDEYDKIKPKQPTPTPRTVNQQRDQIFVDITF